MRPIMVADQLQHDDMKHKFHFDSAALSRNANASGVLIAFVNCKLLKGGHIVQEDLYVEDGRILSGEEVFYTQRRSADVFIDCAATCTVCLGHTSTRLATAERAVGCGARGITHLFNAMLPYHHRDPTLLGLLAGRNIPAQVHYGIIADGLHTHDSALSIAYRTHPSGLVLVSDAISALGMGDGLHQLGTAKILVDGNKATVADAPLTPLAGSVTPLDECVRHFREAVHCSPAAAVQCATEHPATLLGIKNERGNLAPGCRADLVLLDDELNVRATFIAGRLVWPVKED